MKYNIKKNLYIMIEDNCILRVAKSKRQAYNSSIYLFSFYVFITQIYDRKRVQCLTYFLMWVSSVKN